MHVDDNDRFLMHLTSAQPLEVLLRGHLWVEAELIAVLKDVFPFPSQIDLGRISFPQKVSLVAAHGFIRPEDIPAYMKLNSLRNKVAHNLSAEPGEEYSNALLESFGAHLNYLVADFQKPGFHWDEWIWRLRYLITALCLNLSTERERLYEYRKQVQYANEKLRASAQHLLDVVDAKTRSQKFISDEK
jgi:hypothetical protein